MSAPEYTHIYNPHVLFGTNWQELTPEAQAKRLESRDVYRPSGPTPQAFSTPPASPAMFSPASTGNAMKISGGVRASPHAAAVRAQLAQQQSEGRVSNAHLSFGPHTWQHQGGHASPMEESPAVGINTARLDLRAAHQEQHGQ